MTKKDRQLEARELRKQGWSVNCIAEEVGAAKSSVSKWTRDIKLTEAQKEAMYQREEVKEAQLKGSQANYIKHHKKRLGYQQKGRKLRYGVCEISISSVQHMQHIYGAIQEYVGIDRPEWVYL